MTGYVIFLLPSGHTKGRHLDCVCNNKTVTKKKKKPRCYVEKLTGVHKYFWTNTGYCTILCSFLKTVFFI